MRIATSLVSTKAKRWSISCQGISNLGGVGGRAGRRPVRTGTGTALARVCTAEGTEPPVVDVEGLVEDPCEVEVEVGCVVPAGSEGGRLNLDDKVGPQESRERLLSREHQEPERSAVMKFEATVEFGESGEGVPVERSEIGTRSATNAVAKERCPRKSLWCSQTQMAKQRKPNHKAASKVLFSWAKTQGLRRANLLKLLKEKHVTKDPTHVQIGLLHGVFGKFTRTYNSLRRARVLVRGIFNEQIRNDYPFPPQKR